MEVIADLEQSCVSEVLGRKDWFEGVESKQQGATGRLEYKWGAGKSVGSGKGSRIRRQEKQP